LIIAVPLLINILAIFIWFLHWHGYWKSLNLKVFFLSFFILSFFLWLQIKGEEFGAIYFFVSTSIIGLLYLVESKHSFKDLIRSSNKHSSKVSKPKITKYKNKVEKITLDYINPRLKLTQFIPLLFKSLLNLLLMILVPFFAAASISLLLPTVFGIKDANILVSSLFVFLISWSLLLTWVYMKSKRTVALCLLSLTSIITLTTIYISATFVLDISNTSSLTASSFPL